MTNAIKKNEKKLPISPIKLFNLLNSNNVNFELYKHYPLYSVSESKVAQENIFPSDQNSVHIKNLYLRDKKHRNYLITCEQDKSIDLKILKEKIKSNRLSFGSPDKLFQHLGVFPGSVSPFCMLNGIKNNVNFYCDYDLKGYTKIFLHPFTNDKTIYMNLDDLEKFLKKYHINLNWIKL